MRIAVEAKFPLMSPSIYMDTGVIMNSMGHKIVRLLLVMLLSIGLPFMLPGQGKSVAAMGREALVGNTPPPQYRTEEKSLGAIRPYSQEEPLQMMVYGLVLFVLATTFRRIITRSRINAQLKGR